MTRGRMTVCASEQTRRLIKEIAAARRWTISTTLEVAVEHLHREETEKGNIAITTVANPK